MKRMFSSVEKLVYGLAVREDEFHRKHEWWEVYHQFRVMRRRYYSMKWLVTKFPVLTFGFGLMLGLMAGSLLKK